MTKTDRRVQRTRALLQQALIGLVSEHGYEAITIQDIVDRANVVDGNQSCEIGPYSPIGST